MKKKIICILIVIFLLIAFGMTVTIEWLYDTFGHLTMDEIIFHIKVPMEGTNTDIIFTFVKQCILKVIIPTIIISIILIYPTIRNLKIKENEIHTAENKKMALCSLIIAILIFAASINKVLSTTDLLEYIESQMANSNFIAKEYVAPERTKIEFPEEKRNLIYIFLESMETTYYSKEEGGMAEQSLIPEIAQIAKENINFSDSEKLGGAHALYGTTWTVGAMTAQTAGVPLKLSIDVNALDQYSTFLEGAYTIGEILESNGYHNFLLLGSDATFGGRRNLFTQHGNYEIWDFESALAENKVNEKIWWGYTDEQLFEYAKDKLLELSKKEEPFNFSMLTADTHFPDGYKCEDCPPKWDEQYKNVISCSSRKVGELIKWIQNQDFYENTTIVIAGDHLTMQSDFYNLEEKDIYEKKVVHTIINSAIDVEEKKFRQYSTLDLYPTTLAALGATIEGDKLGLGANLFSEEQTLIERYGLETVNNELMKTSRFYINHILAN